MEALASQLQVAGTPETSLLPALPPPAGKPSVLKRYKVISKLLLLLLLLIWRSNVRLRMSRAISL